MRAYFRFHKEALRNIMEKIKLVDFQPGDGTRYWVGIRPLNSQTAKAMGYGTNTDVVHFTFGPATWVEEGHCCGYVQLHTLAVHELVRSMGNEYSGFTRDSHTSYAAALVLNYLTGVTFWGESKDSEQLRWRNDWWQELRTLRDAYNA